MIKRNVIQDKLVDILKNSNLFLKVYETFYEPEQITSYPSCCLVKSNEIVVSKLKMPSTNNIQYLLVIYVDNGSQDREFNPGSRKINDLLDDVSNLFFNQSFSIDDNINTLDEIIYSCMIDGVIFFDNVNEQHKSVSYATVPILIKKVI